MASTWIVESFSLTAANPTSCSLLKRDGDRWVCYQCGTRHKTTSDALYHECSAKKRKEVPRVAGSLVVLGSAK